MSLLTRQTELSLTAFYSGILNYASTHNIFLGYVDQKIRLEFLTFIMSLAAGSSIPLSPMTNANATHRYLKVYNIQPGEVLRLSWKANVSLDLKAPPRVTASAEKLAWITYIILRFTVKGAPSDRVKDRIKKIAIHHGFDPKDMQKVLTILLTVENTINNLTLTEKCRWWDIVCTEFSTRRTDLSSLVYTMISRLAQSKSVTAYNEFVKKGGHEGCLMHTDYLYLEELLFNSPSPPCALYIATFHLLLEDDCTSSLFSEQPIIEKYGGKTYEFFN